MPSTPFHLSTSPLGARDINWESCEHHSVWTELYLGRYSVCIIWAVLGERATLSTLCICSFLSLCFILFSLFYACRFLANLPFFRNRQHRNPRLCRYVNARTPHHKYRAQEYALSPAVLTIHAVMKLSFSGCYSPMTDKQLSPARTREQDGVSVVSLVRLNFDISGNNIKPLILHSQLPCQRPRLLSRHTSFSLLVSLYHIEWIGMIK